MSFLPIPEANEGWDFSLDVPDSEPVESESEEEQIDTTLYIWPKNPRTGERKPNPKQKQIWYERYKPHLHRKDVLLLLGVARGGKCFQKGTKILMFDGTQKNVEDVAVGDKVMGPDSKPRTVLELARGREKMYRVTSIKGDSHVVNASHVLSLKESGWRYPNGKRGGVARSGAVRNLPVEEYINLSRAKKHCLKLWKPEGVHFPPIEKNSLKIHPYFLGIWLGDGHSYSHVITNPEPEIENWLRKYADHIHMGIKKRFSNSKGTCPDLSITNGNCGGIPGSNKVLSGLQHHGLIQNKHIPHEYLTSSWKNRMSLLAGLLDTDGCLTNGTYYEITQKSKRLADDICFLARSLGFSAYIKEVQKYCVYKGERRYGYYHRVHICGPIHTIPLKVKRKKAQILPENRRVNHLVSGFTIEELPEDDYYGFSVDGDHLFLLGDYTVTHNSVGAVARFLYLAYMYPGCKLIVGSINFTHLENTIIEDYKRLLSINDEWDHPFVKRKPGKYRKRIEFVNGSVIYFVNLEKFLNTLGMGVDGIHIEEVQLLRDEDMLDTLITRISGEKIPFSPIILTANPLNDLGWIETRFQTDQLDPDYLGDKKPVGRPCECQYCFRCKTVKDINIPWMEGRCPECGSLKRTDCPGNQYFHRVLLCLPEDNMDNLPEGYSSDLRLMMRKHKYEQFGKGTVRKTGKGRVYESFSAQNIRSQPKDLDPLKDIIWSHDFNNHPMCSAVMQIGDEIVGAKPSVNVLGEIIAWGASAAKVAQIFVERYGHLLEEGFQGKVLLYGDPTAHTRANMMTNRYFQIKKILEKAGFDVEIKVDHTVYAIDDRVETMNYFLCDGEGKRRLMFNPGKDCAHLIASAEKITWDRSGKKEDENFDRRARDSKQYHLVHAMTHPMAAVGYFFVKEYPVVDRKKANAWFINPATGKIVEMVEGILVERSIHGDDGSEDIDPGDYIYDQDDLNNWDAILEPKDDAVADILRGQKIWGLQRPFIQ